MSDTTIAWVDAREILDSRGNPTVEVDVVTEDGSLACPRRPAPAPACTRPWSLRDGRQIPLRGQGRPDRGRQRHRRIGRSIPRLRRRDRPASMTS